MSSKKLSYPSYSPRLREIDLKHPEIDGFEVFLTQHRGLRKPVEPLQVATCFLDFLTGFGKQLAFLNQKDIDDFISEQGTYYKRQTVSSIASSLRSFFRYLFFTGSLKRDFSQSVHSPYTFRGERDPRYLKPWQVKLILSAARRNHTAMGKRNYAILVLLAIYGLRGHEIFSLQLDDLCWKSRKLTICRRKCADTIVLPLVPQAGQALADYLSVRPAAPFREVFLSAKKPFHSLKRQAISTVVQHAIACCGIDVVHPGTRTFRYSTAQCLFQAQSPLSEIAGILGHSSLTTTFGYLSFVVHPLREVAQNDGEALS